MNYVKKICLVLIMLAANFSYANESSRDYNPDATCGDFLRQFDHHAPNYFEYYDCQEEDSYLRPISAYYKVEGKYAKQAEQYLIDKTGIGN